MSSQTYPIASKGFEVIRENDDDANVGVGVGGTVLVLTAGAALKIGEAVYLSADKTVNKSATTSNHQEAFGVVVGGENTDLHALGGEDLAAQVDVLVAADSGEKVLVLVSGVYLVIADGAIGRGAPIALSASTAGRVRAGAAIAVAATGLTIAAGATPVTSSAANGAIISGAATVTGDEPGTKFGRALQAAANNGDKILAYINI